MAGGVGLLSHRLEHAGKVPVSLCVVGLLPDDTFQSGLGQLVFAKFFEHAAQACAGLKMIVVEFDRHVIPLAGGRQVTDSVEQFGQEKRQLRRRGRGLQHGSDRLRRLHKMPTPLKVC